MSFLFQIPFFHEWESLKLRILYINSKLVKYKKGEKVYNEYEEPQACYFVL